MKDELITFETAKLAKEKGFKEITNRAYKDFPGFIITTISIFAMDFKDYNSVMNNYWNVSAPTQPLLQTWLREKHNIHVSPNYCLIGLYEIEYEIEVYDVKNHNIIRHGEISNKRFNSHEEALERGLQEALKLITTPLQECNSK